MDLKMVFLICLAISAVTTALSAVEKFAVRAEHAMMALASVVVSIMGIAFYKLQSYFIYILLIRNKTFKDSSPFGQLLGVPSLTPRDRYILSSAEGRMVGHAYFEIKNVPYMLDDLEKDKKVWMVGNFNRILSSLNFPYELIPRIMPVSSSQYLGQINKQIEDLRAAVSAEGRLASPKKTLRLKQLETIAKRISEGEGVREVSFLCHIMVEGKDESVVAKELEANAKTLLSVMESGLNVQARRLTGKQMNDKVREFFRACVKVKPSKTSKFLTWDLAYLIPLAKSKLPPLEKLLKGVYLGRTSAGVPIFFEPNSMPSGHIACLGKSGFGKSSTVKTLASRLYDLNEISILIVDYAGEYAPWVLSRGGKVIDMQQTGMNPFEIGPSTLTDRIRQIMDALQRLVELSLVQRNELSNYIIRAYRMKGFRPDDPLTWKRQAPTIDEIVSLINDDLPKSSAIKRSTLMALTERLESLSSGPMGIFRKSTFDVSDIIGGFVCIDLSRITSSTMKDMIAYSILQYVDSEMRTRGLWNEIRLVVVLDEAWKLCRDEDSLPVTIIKEGRKFGYALVVSLQDATADLAESILSNAGTVIIHHTEHPKYLRFFENAYGLTKDEVARIRNAPIGEALMKIGNDPRPFFVSIEMEHAEQAKTPQILTIPSESGIILPDSAEPPQIGRTISSYAETEKLTEKGRQLTETKEARRKGGAIHSRIVKMIARKFSDHSLAFEYPLKNGMMTDIVLNETAIEVQVRDWSEDNIRKNLNAGLFEKVIVITLTKAQAESFNLKIQETFPNEKAEAVDISSFLDRPESFIGAEA